MEYSMLYRIQHTRKLTKSRPDPRSVLCVGEAEVVASHVAHGRVVSPAGGVLSRVALGGGVQRTLPAPAAPLPTTNLVPVDTIQARPAVYRPAQICKE